MIEYKEYEEIEDSEETDFEFKQSNKRMYIADIETEPFREESVSEYTIKPFFINFQDFYNEENISFKFENLYSHKKEKQNATKELKDFIQSLTNLKSPSLVYFHNLDFDSKFFLSLLPAGYNRELLFVGGKLAKIRLFKVYERKDKKGNMQKYSKTALEFRDSVLLLLTSVKNIGKALMNQKLEVKYEFFTKEMLSNAEIYNEALNYCEQDCRIVNKGIKELLMFLLNHFGIEIHPAKIPLTLPSLAKKVWFKLILENYADLYENPEKEALKLISIPKWITEKFRPFYFGGRVEVFNFNLAVKGCYNDYNSFYPKQMFDLLFPIPPYSIKKVCNSKTGFDIISKNNLVFGVIAEIDEKQNIPLIPIRLENGKTLYCNGKKLCFLFRMELDYLVSLKQKIIIKEVVYCKSYEPLFKKFVEKTYEPRQKLKDSYACMDCFKEFTKKEVIANNMKCLSCNSENLFPLKEGYVAYLLKIFMNSLYGKFAERTEKEQIIIFESIDKVIQYGIKEKFLTEPVSLQDKSNFLKKYCETAFYGSETMIKFSMVKEFPVKGNIFFSMLITASARLQLHKDLLKAGLGLFYCDTDSIVSQSMLDNSSELGKMKPEFIFNKFQAFSCKEYVVEFLEPQKKAGKNINYEVKMKGFHIEENISLEDYSEFYLNEFNQFRPAKLKETFKRKLNPYLVLVFQKQKHTFYDKRWINKDLTTKPFNKDKEKFEDLQVNNELRIKEIVQKYLAKSKKHKQKKC